MQITVRCGVVWKYRVASGWFTYLKATPPQALGEHEEGWM